MSNLEASVSGFDLKQLKTSLLATLRSQLTDEQKKAFIQTKSVAIFTLVRKNGKIEEVVFQLPSRKEIDFKLIERVEQLILGIRVPVKDPTVFEHVKYTPLTLVIRQSDLY